MLAVPADRLPAAIGDLDPGNRALLDLSLRRGVSDAEIGELLRKEPGDVARGRDAVLELLADALDVGGPDRRERIRQAVAALPDDAWRAGPPPSPPSASVTLREPRAEPPEPPKRPVLPRDRDRAATARDLDDELHFEPEKGSRRIGLLWLLGLMAVLGALAAILLSSGGDDDDSNGADGNRSEPPPSQGPSPEPGGRTAELDALAGGPGGGRLVVTDEGATITLRGLPDRDGAYEVWLYDSVVRAKSLGTVPSGSGRLEASLPADAGRYRFLDVSLEPADGNPNHSGDSVLRAPLRELLSD